MKYNNLPIRFNDKFAYNISIQNDFDGLISIFEDDFEGKYAKVCIVTDSNVAKLYAKNIENIFEKLGRKVIVFSFEAGEASKNIDVVMKLYEELIINHFDRKDLLVALGGGVVGDLTGFTASTYLRGIDFIQIPTTLLSQVDSSIGGKTGVDFLAYKNMIGAFHMPKLVYINISTLKTLDEEQFQCGMGEIIKHGLIRNKEYFEWLKDNLSDVKSQNEETLATMVYESCKIKGNVVEIDPTEQNIRAYLNFGHTLGHAIEKLSNFNLYHGQCVALGMVAALNISCTKGFITQEELSNAVDVISAYSLPTKLNEYASNISPEEVINATKSDKKMEKGKIKFVILEEIGNAAISLDITDEDMLQALKNIY